MARVPTQQKLLEALAILKCWEDKGRSKDTRVFRHDLRPDTWLFLGPAGFRVGQNIPGEAPAHADRIRLLKVWTENQKAS